jgi:hypothetical protein
MMLHHGARDLAFAVLAWLSATWLTQDFRSGPPKARVDFGHRTAGSRASRSSRRSADVGPDLAAWLSGPGRVTIVDFVARDADRLLGARQQFQRCSRRCPRGRLMA